MTKRTINAALKRAGLPVEIQNNRDGYSYFTHAVTGYQIGESVLICYLSHQTVEQWVEHARWAINHP